MIRTEPLPLPNQSDLAMKTPPKRTEASFVDKHSWTLAWVTFCTCAALLAKAAGL